VKQENEKSGMVEGWKGDMVEKPEEGEASPLEVEQALTTNVHR